MRQNTAHSPMSRVSRLLRLAKVVCVWDCHHCAGAIARQGAVKRDELDAGPGHAYLIEGHVQRCLDVNKSGSRYGMKGI